MSLTKKRVLITVACITFIILYIIFAFRFSGDELQLKNQWTVSATKINEKTIAAEEEKQYAFKLGQNLGYFTSNGEISMAESFPYMATISNQCWTTYTSSAENTPIYDINRNQIGTITLAGFPYFTELGNYIFLPGGMSFAALNQVGESQWVYEDVTPITSFYPYENGVIVGFAEGKIINFDKKGNIQFVFAPGGSNYSVILGAAASSDGTYSACVSGIEKQRLVVMKTANQQTKTIYHEYLDGDLREQTFVKFSKDDTKVFFNEKNGLGVFDIENLKTLHIPVEGKILSIQEMEDLNLFFVLTKTKKQYKVYILEDLGNLIGSFVFNANNGFILVDENVLYTGADTTITKTEVYRW